MESTGDDPLEMVFNALGELKPYFRSPSVQEIMINGPDDVFIEEGGKKRKIDVKLSEEDIYTAIAILAGRANKTVRPHSADCYLNERWPGARVCAVLPPISLQGPVMSIRKHSAVRYTLDELCASGSFNENVLRVLKQIVRTRKNILVVGGTSSGKTTFLKALIREIDPEERLVTIEDLPELDVDLPNKTAWETRESLGIGFRETIMLGLRFNPDRFILGEVRDGAALDLLNAANTGHDGCMATLHANSAYEGLIRFEDLVMQAGSRIPLLSIQRRIATTFHYVIFMGTMKGKRQLLELLKMEGFDAAEGYTTTEIYKEERNRYE